MQHGGHADQLEAFRQRRQVEQVALQQTRLDPSPAQLRARLLQAQRRTLDAPQPLQAGPAPGGAEQQRTDAAAEIEQAARLDAGAVEHPVLVATLQQFAGILVAVQAARLFNDRVHVRLLLG